MSIDSQMNQAEREIEDSLNQGEIDENEYHRQRRDMHREFKDMAEEDAQDEKRNEQHYN
jgi:hypothetical protein